MSNSFVIHGLWPSRLPCPWDFPGKNTGNVLPFLSPGGLPDPGIEAACPALAGGFFTTEPPGKLFAVLQKQLCYMLENVYNQI